MKKKRVFTLECYINLAHTLYIYNFDGTVVIYRKIVGIGPFYFVDLSYNQPIKVHDDLVRVFWAFFQNSQQICTIRTSRYVEVLFPFFTTVITRKSGKGLPITRPC